MADVASKVPFERFLTSDQRKAASEPLCHEMTGLTEFLLVGLSDEVLRD